MSTNTIWWVVGVVVGFALLWKRGGLLLKAILALVLVGAFLQVAPNAFAAQAKPWVTCGSTITFDAGKSYGAPEGIAAAVSAAYAEVAPLADLIVLVQPTGSPGTATVTWHWSDPGAGIDFPDADSSDKNSMTGVTTREHLHSASAPNSGTAVKTMLRRDIGRDFGLTLQATNGHLTKADKAALTASCKAQAASAPVASSTPAPAAAVATPAPDGPDGVDAPATATPPATPVTVTAQEKVIGYGGAGAAGIVLIATLFGGRIRNHANKRGIKVPSWSSVWDRVQGLRKRPSKAKSL